MRHTWQQTAEEATVDDDEDVSEDEDPLELSTSSIRMHAGRRSKRATKFSGATEPKIGVDRITTAHRS